MAAIFGITGTIGAGKGTIVEHLAKKHHYKHFSVRKFLIEILTERRVEPTRDAMTALANELRKEHGPIYIVGQMLESARLLGCDAIIESIRTKNEVDYLIDQGVIIMSVDAERSLRFSRILERGDVTDHVNFEKFCEQEDAEMYQKDPDKQNLSYCMSCVDKDFKLTNNGTLAELHSQIDQSLQKLDLRFGKLPLTLS